MLIDNESARHAIVRRHSPNRSSAPMVLLIHRLLVSLGIRAWFARVPSIANPADMPSIIEVKEAASIFQAKPVGVLCEDID